MPTHDIIDNRKKKLVEYINRILSSTEAARFAVGYFFLSGFESIAAQLTGVKELRLLIGNTTNRETLEQIAEGVQRLNLVKDAAEADAYPKDKDKKRMAEETAQNIRATVELMDQTDEGEALIKSLAQMIEENRLKVRVYTKGRLHAKAYIFDYRADGRLEEGTAIVGSSNLTLAGVSHNTELNVVVGGNDNHSELVKWFDELWDEAEDFDAALMREMQESWAVAPARPYDIYMKTIYALVRDRLEGGDDKALLFDDEITSKLADFQYVAVHQAIQIMKDNGGAFISDVVGLGKSYIGAAIIKHFERSEHARPLIICPAPLVDMWERYNEVYQLNARVLSMGLLREDEDGPPGSILDDVKYRDRDLVLVDESHNFRYADTQRYKILEAFLGKGEKRCCFLTATPRNKSAMDVYYQIKLFHQEDKTYLPIDPPSLKAFFKLIEHGERKLPDLLSHILIRRTRSHILRWYGYDATTHEHVNPSAFGEYLEGWKKAYVLVGGKHQFFPKRELETIEYSIEDTYQGLYQQLRGYMGKSRKGLPPTKPPDDELTYARYGLWHYVAKDKRKEEPYVSLQRAGTNLRGLIRILLFKRFESSVYAFQQTVRRLLKVHERFRDALSENFIPAGDKAQDILYEPNEDEEQDLIEALRHVSGRYLATDFDTARLREDIEHDIRLLKQMLALVEPITPDKDAKLQTLIKRLEQPPLKDHKRLIFTQYADTARYLYDNLNPGGKRQDIDVIYSGDKSKTRIVGRFAPKANPEYRFAPGEQELFTVIATDVLAEGLNLQDCDTIVNYDLHWNPVRLIQRFGRIDRIGTESEVVYGLNFLPETGIERNLGLKEKLHNRIQEIHDTIGEDAAILDRSEQINDTAMYAIYERGMKGDQRAQQRLLFSEYTDDEEEFLDLNEAEEILRKLRHDDKAEYDRIANLRDGIRAAMQGHSQKGLFVFCQAGNYQQLFLADANGDIISRDLPRVLGAIECAPEQPGAVLPSGYNAAVMKLKRRFDEEVRNRQARRNYTTDWTLSQRYVLRHLQILFDQTDDENMQSQMNILEKAFRGTITVAINKELNRLRLNSITGETLVKKLAEIYYQYDMSDRLDRRDGKSESPPPKIVCSEWLL